MNEPADSLSGLDYTTLPALHRLYAASERPLACRARTRAEFADWRKRFAPRLAELLGGFPAERPPLDAHLLETEETPAYRLEKVAFQSEPGVYVPCYVLIPRSAGPPYRPVIALHGHGTGGAAHTVGRIVNPATCAEEEAHIRAHNYDYGHQLAEHGFLVFAPEQRGFGERLERGSDRVQGEAMWRSSCQSLALNALLVGKTAIGLRVWDAMRTVDYVHSRPEPVVAGLGCLGLSGGGTTALFAAALEPRISAAVVSGYVTSWRDALMAFDHCACNYIPGIARVAEMADVAALIAPRPLLVESGSDDPMFPVEAARHAGQKVQRIYRSLGMEECFCHDVFQGGHRFHGAAAFPWLERWLSKRPRM